MFDEWMFNMSYPRCPNKASGHLAQFLPRHCLFIHKMQVVAYQFVTHWIADFQVHGSGSFGEMGLVLI